MSQTQKTIHTVSELVDKIGELKEHIAELEKEEDCYTTFLKEKYGVGTHEGEIFRINISLLEEEHLNKGVMLARLSSLMDDDKYKEFLKQVTTNTKVYHLSCKIKVRK